MQENRADDGNTDALAFGMAHNVLKESLRHAAGAAAVLGPEALSRVASAQPNLQSAGQATRALAILEPEDRALLEQYYLDRSTADHMAARWSLSPSGLRTRVSRLRHRLRQALSRNILRRRHGSGR